MASVLGFDQQYHGKNVTITGGGKTASKIKKNQKEAVVVSSRALYNNELFEVELGSEAESMVSSTGSIRRKKTNAGAIRIGVTGHRPADLWHNFPQTMKKMNSATWMMSGDAYLENGETVITFTKHNLKEMQFGEKVGVMRCPEFEGSLLLYLNQECVGVLATSVPDKVFAFVELSVECERVSLTPVHSVSQESLPIEIREVREKESEVRRHKKTIQEKEEVVQVLEKRIDELNAQISTMQASKPGRSTKQSTSAAPPTQQSNGQATDAQGMESPDIGAEQPNPPKQRRHKKHCTIM